MKFFVIGDKDTVLGFRLAGVHGEVVDSADAARASLKKAFEQQDIGIVIIPERIAQSIRYDVDQYMYKTTFPLIIEVPDREGPLEAASIRDVIRSAVGIHM